MKFFKSKKKIATEEVAEKVAEAVEKTEELSSELREELEATVVPELKDEQQPKARKSFTIRKAPMKKAAKEDAKQELKEGEEAPAAAESKEGVEIVEELGIFDYNDCKFALAYGVFNSKDHGVPAGQKMLLMRWNGAASEDWFPMPPLFNQVIMRKLYDRKSEEDIDFLLKEFGHSPK
jgi:hypothetical protein